MLKEEDENVSYTHISSQTCFEDKLVRWLERLTRDGEVGCGRRCCKGRREEAMKDCFLSNFVVTIQPSSIKITLFFLRV